MNEEWKPINGFAPFYMISNLGRIKSLARVLKIDSHRFNTKYTCYRRINEKIIKLHKNIHGYYFAGMINAQSKFTRVSVHRLVALAFIDNPRKCRQVNHIDGSRTNNEAINLEWVTAQENLQHASRLGILKDRVNTQILDEKIANQIRIEYAKGNIGQFAMAKKYGCTQSHISNIITGRCWNRDNTTDGIVTNKIVKEICSKYAKGNITQEKLAIEYELRQGTVSLIVNKLYAQHNQEIE